MGRWFRPDSDYPAELVDRLPGQGIGNPYWRCRCCIGAARMLGIYWCKRCADARIAKRQAEPVEVARRHAIVQRLDEIDAELTRGAYDAATLLSWFAWIDRARRYEVECTLPVTMRLGAAMGATLPAAPIRVDSVLPFRSRRVYESRVVEYLAARGPPSTDCRGGLAGRTVNVNLVDGRHRMSAALVLGLKDDTGRVSRCSRMPGGGGMAAAGRPSPAPNGLRDTLSMGIRLPGGTAPKVGVYRFNATWPDDEHARRSRHHPRRGRG